MNQLRRILNFRKPEFISLDYIPIVIHQKKLLLISWHIPAYCKVHFSNLSITKSSTQSAVVVKLPLETTCVKISVKSFWRKSKYILNLQEVSLSPESSSVLIQQLEPLLMPEFKIIDVCIKPKAIKIRKFDTKPITKSIKVKALSVQLSNSALDYKP